MSDKVKMRINLVGNRLNESYRAADADAAKQQSVAYITERPR